jgi:hypothetical protein
MDVSAALIVNIAPSLIAFAMIMALAVWAVTTGARELRGRRGRLLT